MDKVKSCSTCKYFLKSKSKYKWEGIIGECAFDNDELNEILIDCRFHKSKIKKERKNGENK